jgi:predicted transposase/invertase (TIGR01784 family)
MTETKEKSTQKYRMTHDAFFKQCMADKIVAREILETKLLPKDILSAVDLSSLKLEKSDFADKTLGRGISDVLYSVNWNNKKGYISLLLEHQSIPDKLMTFRIMKYMLKIVDLHLIHNKEKELPLIYPAILYSGSRPYTSPRSFF